MVSIYEPRRTDPSAQAGTLLLLPGSGYTWQAPLLYWSTAALVAAGWRVFVTEWEQRIDTLEQGSECVAAALSHFIEETGAPPDLIVGKSLGTFSLPWAVENGVPGVWFTPLLTEPTIINALRLADDRHLAIGGTADSFWQPDAIAGTSAVLLSESGGDHSLEVDGDTWSESVRIQSTLIEQVVAHSARFRRSARSQ